MAYCAIERLVCPDQVKAVSDERMIENGTIPGIDAMAIRTDCRKPTAAMLFVIVLLMTGETIILTGWRKNYIEA